MKRRELLWGAAAGAQAAMAQAGTGASTPADDLAAAKERVKGNSVELAKFEVARDMEPGFVFKA